MPLSWRQSDVSLRCHKCLDTLPARFGLCICEWMWQVSAKAKQRLMSCHILWSVQFWQGLGHCYFSCNLLLLDCRRTEPVLDRTVCMSKALPGLSLLLRPCFPSLPDAFLPPHVLPFPLKLLKKQDRFGSSCITASIQVLRRDLARDFLSISLYVPSLLPPPTSIL